MNSRFLRSLIIINDSSRSDELAAALEELGIRVQSQSELLLARSTFLASQPDLVVLDEHAFALRETGLEFAAQCVADGESFARHRAPVIVLLVPVMDWARVVRARRTGAHVVVSTTRDMAPAIRYIQNLMQDIKTDKLLGPSLDLIHGCGTHLVSSGCTTCKWIGCSITYGGSRIDVHCPGARAAILNALASHRRGLSNEAITEMLNANSFLRGLTDNKPTGERALKMQITRLRQDFDAALRSLGIPYSGFHFLPEGKYATVKYRLAGNWQLIHI